MRDILDKVVAKLKPKAKKGHGEISVNRWISLAELEQQQTGAR